MMTPTGGSFQKTSLTKNIDEGLVSHTAEYDFDISHSNSSSSIVDARGAMGYKFEKVCDGWITEMHQVMLMQTVQGNTINSSFSMTQWESSDSSRYRFRLTDFLGGHKVDEVAGEAVRKDGKVQVTYEIPVEVTDELPADTLFPTQHSVSLMAYARKGIKFANDLVFDGSGDQPTNRVSVVISPDKKAKPIKGDPDGLTKGVFNRFNMAFFPLDLNENQENSPSTEMAVDMEQNGVARNIILDYGDFTVDGKLTKVSKLPEPVCSNP